MMLSFSDFFFLGSVWSNLILTVAPFSVLFSAFMNICASPFTIEWRGYLVVLEFLLHCKFIEFVRVGIVVHRTL